MRKFKHSIKSFRQKLSSLKDSDCDYLGRLIDGNGNVGIKFEMLKSTNTLSERIAEAMQLKEKYNR